jgi:hypothetical protein
MEYDLYLRREVFEFLRHLRAAQRERLWSALTELGKNPYRHGDFIEIDPSGREVQGLILRQFAIFYWADHAVKEVKVVEIRLADQS